MHKPNPDTIARLVNAHMDAMGAAIDAAFTADVVSDTDKAAAREAMHRLAASARQHLHHLAMELAGGAAYARSAAASNGPPEEAKPNPEPPKPAGWVVRVGKCWAAPSLRTTSGDRLSQTSRRADAVTFPTREEAETWARRCEAATWSWGYVTLPEPLPEILPVDAAGNVIEERAPAPDVVAQCRAAEPTPAPREPDGWVVVSPRGYGYKAWLSSEGADAERAAGHAASRGPGYTARPFWLDTPLVHPSSLTDVVTTLEDERNTLRAERDSARADLGEIVRERADLRGERRALRHALRTIATMVGAAVSPEASTDLHCATADEVRLVVERLTRERDEVRAASQISEENANHWCGRCLDAETQRDAALALARQCRDVALGERGRIADVLRGMGLSASGSVVPEICAPTLPEVP